MTHKMTCYIDCTQTVKSGVNSGIPRVVRSVVSRLPQLTETLGVSFLPVIAAGGRFYRVQKLDAGRFSWVGKLNRLCAFLRNSLDLVGGPNRKGAGPVGAVSGQPQHAGLHAKVLRFARTIMPRLFLCAYQADGIVAGGDAVEFADGDLLLLADSFWNEDLQATVAGISEKRPRIMMVVYDLIAVTHEGVYEPEHKTRFEACLRAYLERVDGIISISRFALESIREYTAVVRPDLLLNYFYLGSDPVPGKMTGGSTREKVRLACAAPSMYLMVGTVEPRKNHGYVLDAFELLWRRGSPASLCIVGRRGWMCDDVIERISRSPHLNRSLFWFSDLEDPELEYCYQKSKAVLMASVVEGFGLPIVEAMHYGKPVFASDIPVFREIGDDYPIFFDLGDSGSLARAIDLYETGELQKQFLPRRWLSWDEAALDLLSKVVAMAR
jgi:O-antigen biosynthesis alpha-1,2-rhamnosyltransferase